MNYFSTQQFDEAFSRWITEHRCGTDEENAAVMKHAGEIADVSGVLPSPSLFERSYLELLSEKKVKEFHGKYVAPVVEQRKRLSVEDYRRLSAREVTRKYMLGGSFREDVDDLIRRKLI